ncbi:uncharacterized protein G2W53_005247 [Senna tora]|uniref:Uncharacterized protein n=1 Tax=Senna tora TaxID=362788 RepID=A0A834XD36_9FABA|nr:uncharacterized protein G2W53_005247 [Senna tora]
MGPLKGAPKGIVMVGQPVNCWTSALKLEVLALRWVVVEVLLDALQ